MTTWKYDNRTYEIHRYPVDGFQLTVFDNGKKIYDRRHIMQTEFEALCDVASELYGEAAEAELIVRDTEIPMLFWEDADCQKCGAWYDYAEMVYCGDDKYLCQECDEEEK